MPKNFTIRATGPSGRATTTVPITILMGDMEFAEPMWMLAFGLLGIPFVKETPDDKTLEGLAGLPYPYDQDVDPPLAPSEAASGYGLEV